MNNTKKIFVLGIARSGTTLLHKLILSHSEVVGINETEILKRVDPEKESVQDMVEKIVRGDEEREVIENFFQKNSIEKIDNPAYFLDLYCQAHQDYFGKDAYVEKSPIHSLFTSYIMNNIQDAGLIIMTRDPRAIMASRLYTPRISRGKSIGLSKWLQFLLNLSELTFTYKKLNKSSLLFQDKILIIKYEDLVSSPKDTMEVVFNFCKLNFEPVFENISPNDLREKIRGRAKQMNSSFGVEKIKVVSDKSLKNWQDKLKNWQIKLIEDVFARLNLAILKGKYLGFKKNYVYFLPSLLLRWFSYLDRYIFIKKNIKYKYKEKIN